MKTVMWSAMLSLLLMAGCQSVGDEKMPESVCPGFDAAGSRGEIGAEKVRLLDQPDVTVVAMRCVVRDELLRVDADVRNDRPRDQRVSYRFQWFDADGMSVDSEEAWKPVLLYPREIKTISTVSPGVTVGDFVLVIKP